MIALHQFDVFVMNVFYFFRIQLAVNIQIPLEYGGLGGKAIYFGMSLNYILILIKAFDYLIRVVICAYNAFVILRHERKLYG